MFSNLATEIFDPARVRFCAASTADMKAGGLAIVESDDLLTAPMESATNDLQMLSLPSGFLPLPASSQGLLGLTEAPPTHSLLHPTKPASTFCFLSTSAVSDLQHCHGMIPSYAACRRCCALHTIIISPRRFLYAISWHCSSSPLLKFPGRPNQASCSIGAQPVPESHGGIVGFSAPLTAQLTVAGLMLPCLYLPNPPTVYTC